MLRNEFRSFCTGAGLLWWCTELSWHNPDAIIERMKRKAEAGCGYFLTQPVYTEEDVERLTYIKEHIDTKIMCGIMPLVSYKNAMFVKK